MPEPDIARLLQHRFDSSQIHASFIFEACLYPLMFWIVELREFLTVWMPAEMELSWELPA